MLALALALEGKRVSVLRLVAKVALVTSVLELWLRKRFICTL